MKIRNRTMRTFFVATILMTCSVTSAKEGDLTREELDFFETKIRPVLVRECYGCHSNQSGNARGGLRLDTKSLMLIGGGTGPAIVPGDPEESWLYNAITHTDFVMPPKRKLPQNVINDFRRWIEMGAPDPRVNSVSQIRSKITDKDIDQAKETFWAFKKPTATDTPRVSDTKWPSTKIDRYILARLEASEMKPASDNDAWKVLRRLSFDLTGLPPSPSQIDSFTRAWKRNQQTAVENTVDQMLRSERYGERWGRHWLDVARYGESTGNTVNVTYPHAWRYRDYVIDAFNDDKPFDRFVQEQLAGDLLPAKTDEDWARNLVATTFLAVGPKNVNEQNRVQFAANVIDEQIDATTRVFLGQSVACARCHDHKFDAIPQTDYYAMAGIFRNMTAYFGNPPSKFGNFSSAQTKQKSSLILLPVADPNPYDKRFSAEEFERLKQQLRDKQQQMADLRRDRSKGSAQKARLRLINEMTKINDRLSVVDENGQPRSYTMGVQERGPMKNARLLVRGEIDQLAQEVDRGFPKVLCSRNPTIGSTSSGRLELAKWIGSDQNTLTARVMVNRIWQNLIGKGIVTSTDNFGVTGATPTHPRLLDYLAIRFVESGWSVKTIVREIATSRIYRASSKFNKQYHEVDPENAFVWRANPRRLDAEAIRDAMLAVSGEIEFDRPRGSEVARAGYTRVRGGILISDPRGSLRQAMSAISKENRDAARKGNRSLQTRQRFSSRGRQQAGGSDFMNSDTVRKAIRKVSNQLDMEDAKFRSVYLPIVRGEEPRSLHVFDFADSSAITGTRESSSTANQALYMMNNPFVIQQSQAFASRLAESSRQPARLIRNAFLLVYGREPTKGEQTAAAEFIRSYRSTTSSTTTSSRPLGTQRSRGRTSRDTGQSAARETLNAFCQSLFASAEFRFLD